MRVIKRGDFSGSAELILITCHSPGANITQNANQLLSDMYGCSAQDL